MAEVLSPIAASILQWWLWLAAPTAAVLLWIRLSGDRRAAAQDLVLRTLVAGQYALLVASAWLTFEGDTSHSAPPNVEPRPAPTSTTAGPAATIAALTAPDSEPPARPLSGAQAARFVPPPVRVRVPLDWPGWASGAFVAVYAAGLLAGLAFVIRDAARMASIRSAARPIDDPDLLGQIARAAEQLGCRARPACLACDAAPGVALVGWRKQAILIAPALLRRLSSAQVRALLVHELGHGLRRDTAWQLGTRLLALATWPLPLNRWVLGRMRFLAEALCDRMALDGMDDPGAYASLLAEAASVQAATPVPFAVHAGSQSSLRRRVEMVLDSRIRSPKAGAAALLGALLTVAALATPTACVGIEAPEQPLPHRTGTVEGAVELDAKPEPSPEVKAAQKRLAETWVELARNQYGAGEYEKARTSLREAFAFEALRNQAVPLGEDVAAIGVYPGPKSTMSWQRRFVPDGDNAFLLACIERLCGPLERGRAGRWVDGEHGLLVQDRALIERICAAMMPPPRRSDVFVVVSTRFYALDPATARVWGARLVGAEARELRHTLSPTEAEELDASIAAADGKIRLLTAPEVTARDREPVYVSVSSQQPYIEKYHLVARGATTVADPVVSTCEEGVLLELLPIVESDGAIALCLRSTVVELKTMREVRLDLPHAAQAPIGVPELETSVRLDVVRVNEGEPVLVGEIPSDSDEERKVAWLRVRASLVRAEEIRE